MEENQSDFEEKPILLINEGFDLETDGIELLQKLTDKNISITSIIGPKFSGKSFLANQINGKFKDGFEISTEEHKDDCCTKGVWIWGKPIIKDNYYILILDFQGFRDDTQENLEYSQKLFALATLISSLVIYNNINDSNSNNDKLFQNSFDLFNKLITFLEKVKIEENDEIEESKNKIGNSNIPKFYFLYRDLESEKLNDFNTIKETNFNNNNLLKNLFEGKIDKYSLPIPMDKNQIASNKYLDSSDDNKNDNLLNQEYKNLLQNLRNKILEKCKPKTIKNLAFNGNFLVIQFRLKHP